MENDTDIARIIDGVENMNNDMRLDFVKRIRYYQSSVHLVVLFIMCIIIGMIIAKLYYSITKQDEVIEIEEPTTSSNINERIILCLNDYIDAENIKKSLSTIEKMMFASICIWIFLCICSNYIFKIAILSNINTYLTIGFFSLFVICFYLYEGRNKYNLKKIEGRGRALLEVFNVADDNKFLIGSLDKYLKLAFKAEIEYEFDQSKSKNKHGCTQFCLKEIELIKGDIKRHREIIHALKHYRWCEQCLSRSNSDTEENNLACSHECVLRFSRVILAQHQEFEYSGSELEFKKQELNKMILKIKADRILNGIKEVPKFEPKKPSLRYRLKMFFKRRESRKR